ncbi:hypothetical protein ME806_11620 [Lactobacillus delbrueckii]|nr:hypothetical protein ME806_11620 [Lactobacillus delbrueckii]
MKRYNMAINLAFMLLLMLTPSVVYASSNSNISEFEECYREGESKGILKTEIFLRILLLRCVKNQFFQLI